MMCPDSVRSDFQSYRSLSTLGEEQMTTMRRELNLPPIRIMDREIEDPNGVMQPLIAHNAWVYAPRGRAIGDNQWGRSQAANLSNLDLRANQGTGPVAYVLEEANPMARNTIVDAMNMPVMKAPNWTYHLQTNAGI